MLLFRHSWTQAAHFLWTQESCYFVFISPNVPEAKVTLRAFWNPQWLTQCPCIANGMQTLRQPCLHKLILASQLLKLGRGSEVSTNKGVPSEGSLIRQCKLSARVRTSSAGDKLRFQLCPSVLHSGFRTLADSGLITHPSPALDLMG